MFSQLCVVVTYLDKEGALRGATTTLRTNDGFQGELSNFLKLTLLSSTQLFALEKENSKICVDISMVSKGHSIALEQQKILLYIMKISEYKKRVLPLLYAWEKL